MRAFDPCVPGQHLALHPTRGPARRAPAAALLPSVRTPATRRSTAPSVAADPGTPAFTFCSGCFSAGPNALMPTGACPLVIESSIKAAIRVVEYFPTPDGPSFSGRS